MKALVVYDGSNQLTYHLSVAIAGGLAGFMDVRMNDVAHEPAPITDWLSLVVIGVARPNDERGLTWTRLRSRTAQRGSPDRANVFTWLERLNQGPHSEIVAAFDTARPTQSHRLRSDAHRVMRIVRTLGYQPAAHETFFTEAGQLVAGELDRARAWGQRLGVDMDEVAHGRSSWRWKVGERTP